jgi:broad specificity phosphatase PhoE
VPRLLLIRHGQSAWNAEQRWQGWADPPLSELGRRQAAAAVAHVKGGDVDFTAVSSSDLRRARESADILASGLGLASPAVDADLRERDIGAWAGCTTAEILERWPGQLEAWRDGRLRAPPGGESQDQLEARVLRGVSRLAGDESGGADAASTLLVVTHGGVIRTVERHLGVEPVTTVNFGGRWIEPDRGELRAGETVVLASADAQTITTLL